MNYPEFHYNGVWNIVNNFGHFIVAFIVVMVITPRFLFSKNNSSLLEDITANFVFMTLFTITLGYILVILKIYELVAIIVITVLFAFRKYLVGKSVKNYEELVDAIKMLGFDYFDGIFHPIRTSTVFIKKRLSFVASAIKEQFKNLQSIAFFIMFFFTLFYSAVLRFYDSFKYAAPALSDAYITLSWMKYIARRQLFEGGIYPRGFHIVLATIQKIAAVDPFYILRFAGPLNGILTMVMLFFFVSRASGRKMPGLIAMFVYGVLGGYLPTAWERQASTNSQEFALVFVLPALYFAVMYMKLGQKKYLYYGAAGVFVSGLVHTLPFALTGMGIGLLILIGLTLNFKEYWQRSFYLIITGIFAVMVAMLPVGLGKLMGYETHSASTSYLTSKLENPLLPALKELDNFALIGLAMMLVYILILFIKKKEVLFILFSFILGATAFSLYYFGGVITKLEMLSNRSGDLWSLILPLCIGMGWFALTETLLLFLKDRVMEGILCTTLILGSTLYLKPEPILPYKMEFDSTVEQYLRISTLFQYTSWNIVSNPEEEFAIVLGQGGHTKTEDFVKEFQPDEKDFKKWTKKIGNHIFIYNEKELYNAPVEKEEVHERKKAAVEKLRLWLDTYKKLQKNWSIFYEDKNLQVIYIQIPEDKEEKKELLWKS